MGHRPCGRNYRSRRHSVRVRAREQCAGSAAAPHAGPERLIASGAAGDLAAATVLGQRVATVEARDSWRTIVRRHRRQVRPAVSGSPRHPTARSVGEFSPLGSGAVSASKIVVRARSGASRSESRRVDRAGGRWCRRLRATMAQYSRCWSLDRCPDVTHFVAADTNAVPVGDWHLKHHVAYALAGERAVRRRGQMLELPELFGPHRCPGVAADRGGHPPAGLGGFPGRESSACSAAKLFRPRPVGPQGGLGNGRNTEVVRRRPRGITTVSAQRRIVGIVAFACFVVGGIRATERVAAPVPGAPAAPRQGPEGFPVPARPAPDAVPATPFRWLPRRDYGRRRELRSPCCKPWRARGHC